MQLYNIDGIVKSRHSGENRSPDGLQLLEKTGFLPDLIRDQPSSRTPIRDGMTENDISRLFTRLSIFIANFICFGFGFFVICICLVLCA